MTNRRARPDGVIQGLCISYRCREARFVGAEPGFCECPCHEMSVDELRSFLALATGGEGGSVTGGAA